jgi:xylan 1,4-beta-xylosidase
MQTIKLPVNFRASTKMSVALGLLAWRVAGTMSFPDCVSGPQVLTSNLVCNTSASPADRAAALVKAFTIDEKLVNLVE